MARTKTHDGADGTRTDGTGAERTEVLIAGGGIVGLSLAVFLRDHGIRTCLVERHPDTSMLPKGRNLNVRTMELYRAHGVERSIRDAPTSVFERFPERARAVTLAGKEIFRESRPAPETLAGISPCEPALVDQSTVEPILRAHAVRRGADVRFATELLSFRQDTDQVTAVLADRTTGASSLVRARYLVAADGHRSPIRGSLGIERDVLAPPVAVASIVFEADLTPALRGRRIALCYLDEPEPNTLLTPLDRADRWLLIVPYHPDRGERVAGFTESRCRKLIRAAVGVPGLPVRVVPAIPGSSEHAHPWELTAWVARAYRAGRVLLAGDAVHVMPPTGGLGANTGVQDAHNLAWKLAAVLRGHAGAGLLDSYEDERRPVARLACEFATHKQRDRTAGRSDDDGPLDALTAIMGYRYRSGAVIGDDGRGDGPVAGHPARLRGEPGTRAPQVDLYRPDRFTLLTAEKDWLRRLDRLAADDAAPPVLPVLADTGLESFGVGRRGAVLVRPDGFVAWRSASPPESSALSLRDVFDRVLHRAS